VQVVIRLDDLSTVLKSFEYFCCKNI